MLVTRFAPSPTGHLHRGHAYSALSAYRLAEGAGGRFLLRIEDIDRTRSRPEFEASILEDLAWLGLRWAEPVRRQSEHMEDYAAALQRLRDAGLLYRDFRSRREIAQAAALAPHGPEAAFVGEPAPDEAERLARGEPFAWRLSLEAAREAVRNVDLTFEDDGVVQPARPEVNGDVVLARKDVGVAYHLAVVLDDALQGITHVIRGEDLREATHTQVLLQRLLGLPTPIYRHHRLLMDAEGRRYAKRDRAETLRDLRAAGVTAAALRAELGFA